MGILKKKEKYIYNKHLQELLQLIIIVKRPTYFSGLCSIYVQQEDLTAHTMTAVK